MITRQPAYGEVWIYDLGYALEMEIGHMGTLDGLEKAIGVTALNSADVQVVPVKTVEELGLPAFLEMAYGIAPADMTGYGDVFSKLSGSIAIVRANAFPQQGITLPPTDQAKRIAIFTEEAAPPPAIAPLTSDSTKGVVPPKGTTAKKPKSDARIGGMVATVALLLMFALVVLMVWIAG